MLVNLFSESASRKFEFLVDDIKHWSQSAISCRYAVISTSLDKPFDRVFVKKWIGRKANADDLQRQAISNPIPGTPACFGIKSLKNLQSNGRHDYYYFNENLPKGTGKNPRKDVPPLTYAPLDQIIDSLRASGSEVLLDGYANIFASRLLISALVSRLIETLYEIRNRGWLFTDLCMKNIMISPDFVMQFFARGFVPVVLIDVDSSYPVTMTEAQLKNYRDSRQYWFLWSKMANGANSPFPLKLLVPTMILSFAIVWIYAFSQLGSNPRKCWSIIDKSLTTTQDRIWKTISSGDLDEFNTLFLLDGDRHRGVFLLWGELYHELSGGSDVEDTKRLRFAILSLLDVVLPYSDTNFVSKPIEPQVVRAAANEDSPKADEQVLNSNPSVSDGLSPPTLVSKLRSLFARIIPGLDD